MTVMMFTPVLNTKEGDYMAQKYRYHCKYCGSNTNNVNEICSCCMIRWRYCHQIVLIGKKIKKLKEKV